MQIQMLFFKIYLKSKYKYCSCISNPTTNNFILLSIKKVYFFIKHFVHQLAPFKVVNFPRYAENSLVMTHFLLIRGHSEQKCTIYNI